MSTVNTQFNKRQKSPLAGADVSFLGREVAEKVRHFHSTFPQYQPTPCVQLARLAGYLGVGEILVKDESYRFGLNAFKVLGGSYAVAKIIAGKLDRDIGEVSYSLLRDKEVLASLGELTFSTTTDGNHGRGLAWAAEQFGQKAVVCMPKGSDPIRRDNIQAHGAKCIITDLNYDDCVRMSYETAEKKGWITVQDTAWDGYTDIPISIMQGYTTLALETLEQIQALGVKRPTHIILQVGVGCFAGAILGFFLSVFGENSPHCIIVEPGAADCMYRSAVKNDGRPHTVGGSLSTLMAGLACGEPNRISWEILRDYPLVYASCSDDIAARGMRILGAPLQGDQQIISGESGAVTTGFLHWVMQSEEGQKLHGELELGPDSRVLCINTEGDTSPKTYRDVVWSGRDSL